MRSRVKDFAAIICDLLVSFSHRIPIESRQFNSYNCGVNRIAICICPSLQHGLNCEIRGALYNERTTGAGGRLIDQLARALLPRLEMRRVRSFACDRDNSNAK